MIGLGSVFYFLGLGGLPVSVASALSNMSMVVTVILSTIVLRQPLTGMRGGAMALMLGGVVHCRAALELSIEVLLVGSVVCVGADVLGDSEA